MKAHLGLSLNLSMMVQIAIRDGMYIDRLTSVHVELLSDAAAVKSTTARLLDTVKSKLMTNSSRKEVFHGIRVLSSQISAAQILISSFPCFARCVTVKLLLFSVIYTHVHIAVTIPSHCPILRCTNVFIDEVLFPDQKWRPDSCVGTSMTCYLPRSSWSPESRYSCFDVYDDWTQ